MTALVNSDPPASLPIPTRRGDAAGIAAIFFVSGFAALVYQVCWQRLLAYGFGVDLESSTIVISCFMLGMGVGALLGGWIADRTTRHLAWFCGVELLIGLFGLASVPLLNWLAASFYGVEREWFIALNFAFLLLPTALMGATLPVLVIALQRRRHSIGSSTGILYCYNTLGAAAGAFATGLLLFKHLGLAHSALLAAGLNLLVATGAFLLVRRQPELQS